MDTQKLNLKSVSAGIWSDSKNCYYEYMYSYLDLMTRRMLQNRFKVWATREMVLEFLIK